MTDHCKDCGYYKPSQDPKKSELGLCTRDCPARGPYTTREINLCPDFVRAAAAATKGLGTMEALAQGGSVEVEPSMTSGAFVTVRVNVADYGSMEIMIELDNARRFFKQLHEAFGDP